MEAYIEVCRRWLNSAFTAAMIMDSPEGRAVGETLALAKFVYEERELQPQKFHKTFPTAGGVSLLDLIEMAKNSGFTTNRELNTISLTQMVATCDGLFVEFTGQHRKHETWDKYIRCKGLSNGDFYSLMNMIFDAAENVINGGYPDGMRDKDAFNTLRMLFGKLEACYSEMSR